MRRRWLITSFVVAMLLVAIVWAIKWERTVPLGQCSRLYQEYADCADVNVSFIKDFYINDSIAVDVTLMQPTTDSAWSALLDEMHISKNYGKGVDNKSKRGVVINWVQKSDITKHGELDCKDSFLQALQYSDGVISYFEMDDEDEIYAVYEYLIKQL